MASRRQKDFGSCGTTGRGIASGGEGIDESQGNCRPRLEGVGVRSSQQVGRRTLVTANDAKINEDAIVKNLAPDVVFEEACRRFEERRADKTGEADRAARYIM